MKIRAYQLFSAQPQTFEAESLAEWLIARYGAVPRIRLQMYAGEPSAETEITGNFDAILAGDAPEYVVLESPGEPISVGQIVMMVASIALQTLMAPDKRALPNRDQQSPNNQLSARSNQVRTMQRVEDIFGTIKSIPSLLTPTYTKFIANQQVEFGYYCVGRGYYDITDLKDGDTLLSQIQGSSAAVYGPYTSPNFGSPQLTVGDPIIDPILSVTRSSSVDGIILKPTNQLQITAAQSYYFYGPGSVTLAAFGENTQDVLWQPVNSRKPNFAAVAQVGQSISITMSNTSTLRGGGSQLFTVSAVSKTYTTTSPGFFRGVVVGSTANITGFGNAANNGAHVVTAVTDTVLTVAETLVNEGPGSGQQFTLSVNYGGTRTIATVQNGYVTLSGTPKFSQEPPYSIDPLAPQALVANATVSVTNGLVDWTDWFTLPQVDRTEVWTNVVAAQGVYKDDGAKQTTTVAYEVQIEELTALLAPTGIVETVSGSVTGTTSNLVAETLEHLTGWVGPARVRARRTTPFDYDFAGAVVDEIKWADLNSVSPVTKADFGYKTTIHTVTKATISATSLSQRGLNCIASRKLPTFNGSSFSGAFDSTGRVATGSISATSRIVDILAAVTVDPKIGNRTISDIDMAQVWSVQQILDGWNIECGQFNYTFDSDQVSFEETLATIANAAFSVAYRQNGKIRLGLDRPQAASVALFTHRNKKPKSETITRKFASDSDYDGVELIYQDPDTVSSETIRLPLDGSYTKLKKVEIPGIRSYTQAWFRANREYNRIRSQRLTIETDVTTDARAILPNSRVEIVDNTKFKSFDGEVVGQSGLTLTLSRSVEFIVGAPHSIVLMKRDGSLQSIVCTAGPSTNQVVLATAPIEAIVTAQTPDGGIRTIFSFAADSGHASSAWLVQSIGQSDGQYIKLQAINYSDNYYAADSLPVPAKESVIF